MRKYIELQIQVSSQIKMPNLPNYLRYGDADYQLIDVAELSDSDLKIIGAEWTKELLAHAAKRRKPQAGK